ncbi:MAG TPA: hypothetical protein VNK51_00120 [Bradyrhizobium sp.]|nr:hypothetical protein [Bradyrhizobium sp.]
MTARTTGASLNQQARLPVQRRTTDLIGAIRMAASKLRTLASFGGLFTGVPELLWLFEIGCARRC